MADTTTVFQSGNSQAVRLPKEFRFKSKTVEIFRRGNEVVLREKPRTMAELMDSLPPATPEMVRELDEMMAAIREPLPPDTRRWDALWDVHTVPPSETTKTPTRATKTKPARDKATAKSR
jgi:antitoxin VapB